MPDKKNPLIGAFRAPVPGAPPDKPAEEKKPVEPPKAAPDPKATADAPGKPTEEKKPAEQPKAAPDPKAIIRRISEIFTPISNAEVAIIICALPERKRASCSARLDSLLWQRAILAAWMTSRICSKKQ